MMRRFLPSVVKHSEPEGMVIVADNGSDDGSLDMLRANFPTLPNCHCRKTTDLQKDTIRHSDKLMRRIICC